MNEAQQIELMNRVNNALIKADVFKVGLTPLQRSRLSNVAAGFTFEEIAKFVRPRIKAESVERFVRSTLEKIPE